MTRDLDADQAVCDAAEPGPWKCIGDGVRPKLIQVNAFDEHDPHGRYLPIVRKPDSYIRDAELTFVAMARTALPYYIAEVRRLRAEMDEYKQKFDKAYLDQGEALSDVHMELSAANLALSIAADRIADLDADIDAKDIELGDLRDIAMEFEPGEMGEFLSWRDAAKEAIKQKDATIDRQAATLRDLAAEKDAEIERLNQRLQESERAYWALVEQVK